MKTIMINPIIQTIPKIVTATQDNTLMTILTYTAFLLFAGIIAFLIGLYASRHFKDDKQKTALIFTGIAVTISVLLICFFGCAVSAIQGILLCLILVYSSYSDIKTRESDDYLALMIALTALIGKEVSDIPIMLLSAVLVTIPMLLVLIICKGKAIGGADIKITTACAFLLGISRGFIGLTVGLLIGIVANIIIQLKKDKHNGFPMLPYLSIGFMIAFFI